MVRQAGVQGGGAEFGEQGARLRAGGLALGGDIGEPGRQRTEIQPRAATQDRALRAIHGLQRGPAPPGGAAGFGGRAYAIQRMGNGRFVLSRRARRQDRQFAVDLHRIRVDHRPGETARQIHRQRRLPAAGRPGDDQRRPHLVPDARSCHCASMPYIVTLVADRQSAPLGPATVKRVRDAIRGEAAVVLSEGEAADINCVKPPDMDAVRAAIGEERVDCFGMTNRGRRKGLLLADMDSTIVTGETLDEIAAYAGLKDRVAAITARSMNGEIDFRDALRERVGLLKGLDLAALEATWATRALTAGARTLVATMRRTTPRRRWCPAVSPSSRSAWRPSAASTCTAPTRCWTTARR